MTLKGILTNCVTGKEVGVELEYEITMSNGRRILSILNGVTGYESFYIDPRHGMGFGEEQYFDNFLKNLREFGWLACAGTKGIWDRLFIPPEEMQKVDFGDKNQ